MEPMEHLEEDISFFFAGRLPELGLYSRLSELIHAAWPGVRVKVSKTQISFANRYNFAFASLPRRRIPGWPERCLIVTFGLGYQKISPRVAESVEPYPGRWTHHVPVAEITELDDELMGWLREAYDFSAAKR